MRQFFLSIALLLCVAAAAQPGARQRFPMINDDLSVTFSARAPQAAEVAVDICGKVYPMTREGDGAWMVTTDPLEPGFREASCRLKGATGIHDLYFVFKEGGFRWDWWRMTR